MVSIILMYWRHTTQNNVFTSYCDECIIITHAPKQNSISQHASHLPALLLLQNLDLLAEHLGLAAAFPQCVELVGVVADGLV